MLQHFWRSAKVKRSFRLELMREQLSVGDMAQDRTRLIAFKGEP